MESARKFYVYILENENHGYYVGYTDDLAKRLAQHNAGISLATRGRGPWKVAYHETCSGKSEAMRRERQIKQMKSRRYIQDLIRRENSKNIGA